MKTSTKVAPHVNNPLYDIMQYNIIITSCICRFSLFSIIHYHDSQVCHDIKQTTQLCYVISFQVGIKIKFMQHNCNATSTTVVRYAMCKVYVAYLQYATQYATLHVKLTLPTCPVPLIYNFTSTRIYTCGAMQYFMWKILFLSMEI